MASADRLIEIFNEAKARPAGPKRDGFLAESCGADAELKEQVLALLRAHENAGAFLQAGPTISPEIEAELARLKPEEAGERIGPYKLREQIGEGGFGVVWVAEQQEPVRRAVALKIIKLGMDTREVVARFEQERQALAMMDHPNIARVLDAGATQHGRPFFVMELVRGIKITDYCDQANLPTAERLALFIQVCNAVQHAHQKGIIHRDLKPSNILVTLHDGVPVPKVIDFGVAKATQGRLSAATIYTQFQQMIGTPVYMSPEQAELSGLDVDTRSDIYSLGILLYELLTGRTPFDPEELMRQGLDEIRRTIREREPQTPSMFVRTMTFELRTSVARHRQADGAKLAGLICGDLDWIVMKAIEKDRARRYATANALGLDIKRHLDNEPVLARRATALYRFRRLVRRNKLAFAATTVVAAVLVLGIMTSTWQAIRASRAEHEQTELRKQAEYARNNEARERANAEAHEKKMESEAAKSQQVTKYLEEMLNSIDPREAKGRDTTLLREILDKFTARVAHDLADHPEVQAQLQNTMGTVYNGIGEHPKAELTHRNALATRIKVHGNEHFAVAESLYGLAEALWSEGKPGVAESPAREALAMRRKLFGNEHMDVADSLNLLALVLVSQDKLGEAESLTREGLAIKKKLVGNESLSVVKSLNLLGHVLVNQRKPAEAETLTREALTMYRNLSGEEYPLIVHLLRVLAEALLDQNRLIEAEGLFRERLAIERKFLGDGHPETGVAISDLAGALCRRGEFAEAETMYRECLTISEKKLPHDWLTFNVRSLLGGSLLGQKKHAEAETLLLSGYEGMKQREEKIPARSKWYVKASLQRLAQLYEATGQTEKVAEWSKKLEEIDKAEAD